MYIVKILAQHSLYELDREFYYLSNDKIQTGVRVIINFHNQEIIGFVFECIETDKSKEELEIESGFDYKFIDRVMDNEPIINDELMKLAKALHERYLYPQIGVLQTMLPPSLKPTKTAMNAPKIKYEYFYELVKEVDRSTLDAHSKKLYQRYLENKKIYKKDQNPCKSLIKLLDLGILKEGKEEINRFTITKTFDYHDEFLLSEEQQKVYDSIVNGDDGTYLLHGVTGSGKTEIYIKLIDTCIKKGEGTILLVPEIALTPLMISRLVSYFKEGVAVLHSSLTSTQKYDEYRKIARGEAKIVVGTRSAIFAPVQNLKLIIIDEENDDSYKQDDQGLLYHATEIARIRTKLFGGKIVLGSATPSIDSYVKAQKGVYKYLTLTKRYKNVNLPEVSIVDMNNRLNFSRFSTIFTLPSIQQIKLALLNNEKIIILINSRGYGRRYYCRECGYVFKCPKCDLPLFYHKEDKVLYCHHCEHKEKLPKKCPKCGGTYFSMGDFGIEKVEEDFKKIFNVPYLVLDSDRTKKTREIEAVLKDFDEGKANVLIGTQLVSKGHDFKNVGLAIVLDADVLMNHPNFRNRENTYSILTQTIGRAGRDDSYGRAIIQTRTPDNPVILAAAEQNYSKFAKYEILQRKKFNYPPYSSVLAIMVSGKSNKEIIEFAASVKNFFESLHIEGTVILGPSKATQKFNVFFTNIFIKYKKLVLIQEAIEDIINLYNSQKKVKLKLNFNPFNL